MQPRKGWVVYGLKDPRTGETHYVGMTGSPRTRQRSHERDCKADALKSWLRELGASGLTPQFEILEDLEGEAQAATAERRWVSELQQSGSPLTNIAVGGKGPCGVRMTPEQRLRMSEARKGYKVSPEVRINMKEAFKKRSPEYFAKNAAILRERAMHPRTAESRSKQSASRKGKPWSDAMRSARARTTYGPWSEERRNAERATLNSGQKVGVKLTPDDVLHIRAMHQPGKCGARRIALALNLPRHAVQAVIDGRTWKHVGGAHAA